MGSARQFFQLPPKQWKLLHLVKKLRSVCSSLQWIAAFPGDALLPLEPSPGRAPDISLAHAPCQNCFQTPGGNTVIKFLRFHSNTKEEVPEHLAWSSNIKFCSCLTHCQESSIPLFRWRSGGFREGHPTPWGVLPGPGVWNGMLV